MDSRPILADVSCPAKMFCAAVDTGGKAFTYEPSGWSQPTSLDASLIAVSCVTRVYCIAITQFREAFTYDGSSWALTAQLPGSNHLADVSCASKTACVAVGERYADVFDGTSWVATRIVAQRPRFVRLRSVSCPSADFCVTVDDSGKAYTYDGAAWSKPVLVTPIGVGSASVSCGAVGRCVMTTSDGKAAELSAGGWSTAQRIDPVGHAYVTSVSCPSAALCTAVDGYGYAITDRS